MATGQRPLELILARNLLASLSTAAFLVDSRGEIAFYNEAAGDLLGQRFEESGPMHADEWSKQFGPFDQTGRPIPFNRLDLTHALRGNRPSHSAFCVRSGAGELTSIEASGLPIVGGDGFRGAIVVFWPVESAAAP